MDNFLTKLRDDWVENASGVPKKIHFLSALVAECLTYQEQTEETNEENNIYFFNASFISDIYYCIISDCVIQY